MILEDRVWQSIRDCILVRKHKRAQSGWINFNCPMCHEHRMRCGVKNNGNVTVVWCFNCQVKSSYRMGFRLRQEMRVFLSSLGIPEREVAHLAYYAEQIRQEVADNPELQHALDIVVTTEFPNVTLPDGARSLEDWCRDGCEDAGFLQTVNYLLSRGDVAVQATTYYWTPQCGLHRRLIIPCYQDERLVGWIGRAVDPRMARRYHKEVPSNYLFNTQFLSGARRFVLIVEGAFDALSIDGVAGLGASLNPQQIAWINQSGKIPVVMPDRDAAGERLIEIAIEQGWAVAAPHYGRYQWWEGEIKDAAQAVARYGKLYVMQSILATQETHAGLIRMRASYHL